MGPLPQFPVPQIDLAAVADNLPVEVPAGIATTVEVSLPRRAFELMMPPQMPRAPFWPPVRAATVKLYASGPGVAVEPVTSETQFIRVWRGAGEGDVMTWRFKVTPLGDGPIGLTLALGVRNISMEGVGPEQWWPEETVGVSVVGGKRRSGARLLLWGVLLSVSGWGHRCAGLDRTSGACARLGHEYIPQSGWWIARLGRRLHVRLWLEKRASPIGDMLLAWDADETLRVLDFSDFESRMQTLLRYHYGDCDLVIDRAPQSIDGALTRYFDGEITALDALPVATGGTDFQKAVWATLRTIPAGQTLSYGALSERLGKPKAVRAVGGANGANPIAIVVPCHRVIGADGTLTGYGGGLPRKRWLLAHEGVHLAAQADLFN